MNGPVVRSTLWRKSLAELTQRRARSGFVVLTLALAVASLGLFAVPPLMDRAMRDEVAAARLADLTIEMRALELSAAQLDRLARLPNVTAVQGAASFPTRVYVGERREPAVVVGVPDFADQPLDVVRVASGAAPRRGEVLTEVQNTRRDRLSAGEGDVVRVIGADGATHRLRVSGEGRSLSGGQEATGERVAVLYTTPATIAQLGGSPGSSSLAFGLQDVRKPAVRATIAVVRRELRAMPGFTGFTDLPSAREPGSWPGEREFERFTDLFSIITLLALVSALVLVSSTMTTLVAEQTSEIGVMKAVGGRRRQIAGIYLRIALLLGALGAVVGVVLGQVVANLLVGFFGSEFFAIDAGIVGVDVPIVAAGLAIGITGPALAALPAIRRGASIPVRDAIEATGAETGGAGRLDRLLRRPTFLPRHVQIGLRSIGRRKRRSLATALQIGLAVGLLLAFLTLGASVAEVTHEGWSERAWATTVGATPQRPFDARSERLIRATPNVSAAQPVLFNEAVLRGHDGFVYGLPAETFLRLDLREGRWYTQEEERAGARVAVLEAAIADASQTRVGETVPLGTAGGDLRLRVIGITDNVQENGTVVFVPLPTLAAATGVTSGVNQYWVRTTTDDRAVIDRTTTRIEDALTARGYEVGTEINYVGERDNAAQNRTITTSITVLGLLIVAISMVGLANAVTMSIIERRREIGILRCVGARGRDVRRIFTAEAVTLAVSGWLLGIPIGYLLARSVIWLLGDVLDLDIPFVFPAAGLPLTLVGAVALSVLVTLVPLRRAVRLRPGDALRMT